MGRFIPHPYNPPVPPALTLYLLVYKLLTTNRHVLSLTRRTPHHTGPSPVPSFANPTTFDLPLMSAMGIVLF